MIIYEYTYIYMHVTPINEKSGHVFGREQIGYIGGYEGRKQKGGLI